MKLMQDPSPWQPENDKLHLAVVGKLGEEASELSSACHRCSIQGVDGKHPVTGKSNREWLQDEIADVLAGCAIAIEHFNLDLTEIMERREMKRKHKKAWHGLIQR